MLPGPGSYNTDLNMRLEAHMAKSMLGGTLEKRDDEGNGFPGPDAYQ